MSFRMIAVAALPLSVITSLSAAEISPVLRFGPAANEVTIATPQGRGTLLVGPRTPVNPPNAGHHLEVMASADPASPENLLVGGARINPLRASGSEGFVYQSSDGGNSWREVLVDASSQWVSEESCTFGLGHVAYFAACASNDVRTTNNHRDGNMRLYRSADGGRTWKIAHVGPFLDWTWMTVDRTTGPNRNTLYIFANEIFDGYGGLLKAQPGLLTHREAPAFAHLAATNDSPEGSEGGYYPVGATVLRSGRSLAICWGGRKFVKLPDGITQRTIQSKVIASDDGGKTLIGPTVICDGSRLTALAVDRNTEELVACGVTRMGAGYPRTDPARRLLVARSADQGKSWRLREVDPPPGTTLNPNQAYGSPSVAINKDGVLALMWYGQEGRVYLAVSYDRGESLAQICELTPELTNERMAESRLDRTMNAAPIRAGAELVVEVGGTWKPPRDTPFGNSLTADAAGAFHPVWYESSNGPAEIYTRAISVAPAETAPPTATVASLTDVTESVVLHTSNCRYDHLGQLVAFDVRVTNKSDRSLDGRLCVMVSTEQKDFHGDVGPHVPAGLQKPVMLAATNSDNQQPAGGAIWELRVPGDRLGSEQNTDPRTLTFYCKPEDEDAVGAFFSLRLHVYGKWSGDRSGERSGATILRNKK